MSDRVTTIFGDQIEDGTIRPEELDSIEQHSSGSPLPDDGDILSWNVTENKFEWIPNQLNDKVIGTVFQSVFAANGNVGNKWLDIYHESVISNSTFFIIPQTARLVTGTFSNANHNADFKVNIWKLVAGDTDVNNKVLIGSWEFENARLARVANISPEVTVNAGDKIAVFIEDIGITLKDALVILYWQITDFSLYDVTSENFSGDFGDGTS